MIVLNAETMACLNVQQAARAALKADTTLVLVHETDGRHGAPLNDDGGFDFGLVFRGAPDDELKGLANNIESIPLHRRGKQFQASIDDMVEWVSGPASGARGSASRLSQARRKQPLIASLNEIKKSQLELGEQIGRGGFGDVFAATYK